MTILSNETAAAIIGGNPWPAALCLIVTWLDVVNSFDCTGVR